MANSLLYPFSIAYAQEETVTPTSSAEPTTEPIATPEITPTPEATVTATPTPSPWTFEKVELNEEYIAPQNSEVKLTFTKLPEVSGSIKIEEITLTEEQIQQTGSLSDKAYDITSDMLDGSFTYNLSLPIPESSKGKDVEVKFAEELSSIASAEKVDNTLTKTDTSVSIENLNHFTIFFVTSSNPTTITATNATLNGLNGNSDAIGHSFWVSLAPFDTTSPTIPAGVYSTPDLGAIAESAAFSASLSSITTTGVPTNLPTVIPNTKYYFAAWSLVGGTWYPGEVLNFTTEPVPVFNGNVTGFVGASGLNVSGNTIGDFETTIAGTLTEYSPGQKASFIGTISGDISGTLTGGVNYNGYDTLFAEVFGTGASGHVYLIGEFSGGTGKFVGRFVTQAEAINFVTGISISGGTSVPAGGELQMSAVASPAEASQNVAWAVYVNDLEFATIDQTTGLLTAIKPGTVTVIASALDGSLVTKNHEVTILPDTTAPTMDSITPADNSLVNGTQTFVFDFADANDLSYLELDIYRPGDTQGGTGGTTKKLQVTLPADDAQIQAALSSFSAYGVTSASYDSTTQKWTVSVDTTKTWDAATYGANSEGTPDGGEIYPDGISAWYIQVNDVIGNHWGNMMAPTPEATRHWIFDNTAPTSSIFFQADLDESKNITTNNRWFESFDNIDLKIDTGDQGADKINYQVLNGDVACPAQNDSNYTATSHNTNLAAIINAKADGAYSMCYYASDLAGNTEASTYKELLRKDNTNPSFTIDSVSGNVLGGVYYNQTDITAQITVSDSDSGYSHARYDLYNADSNHACTTSIGSNQDSISSFVNPAIRTLSKTGLSDGNYCFRVWAYDNVQNKVWTDTSGFNGWIKFTIDSTLPTDPGAPTTTPNPTNSLIQNWAWIDSTDLNGISQYLWRIPSYSSGIVLGTSLTTSLGEGIWSLFIKAQDNTGNQSGEVNSLALTVDTTPPAEPTATFTANGLNVTTNGYTNSKTFTFNLLSTGATRYQLKYWNNITGSVFKQTTPWNPTSLSTIYSDNFTQGQGTHYFAFSACDTAGNCSTYSSPFIINYDTTIPTKPAFTAPANNLFTNVNFVTLNWSGGDDTGTTQSGIKGYKIRYTFVPIGGGSTVDWSSGLITSGNPKTHSGSYGHGQGTYTIYVSTTDNAENVSSESDPIVLNYDATAPTGNWVAPVPGTDVNGIVTLEVSASDATSGVKDVKFQYKRNDGIVDAFYDISTDDSLPSPFTASWDTTTLALDNYTLRAIIEDKAGNKTTIDQINGVAAVISAENGASSTYGTATITWTTDRPTKSRVVYDTVSHSALGEASNYGYAYSTGTTDESPKVTSHTVTITGLSDGTLYYYRTISEGSPIAVSDQKSYRTLSIAGAPSPSAGATSGQVAGVSTTIASNYQYNQTADSLLSDESLTTNEEVLGENTESEKTQTPEVKGAETKGWNTRNIVLISFGSLFIITALLLLRRKKKTS